MHSTDAHCFSCGYDTALMVGSLMSSHQVYSAGPVICEGCKAITTANFEAAELTCETCKSSNVSPVRDSANWLGDDDRNSFKWAELPLPLRELIDLDFPGHYKCPKCGTFELRFGTDFMGHGFRSMD